MRKQNGYKTLSLFLIFVLMLGVVNTGMITAYAEEEAEITGFTLSTTPSAITVTVYEEEPKGTITSFEELEEEIRWQNTQEPVLPEKVKGIVEGRTVDIPVTWEADHDYDPDSPESGLYVFTAKADGDFILADGAEAPRITVYIPKVKKMMMLMAGSADQSDPLVITTAEQLSEIASLVNAGRLESFILNDRNATVYLKLGNDIDLSGYGSGNGWTPIGTYSGPFRGSFDGSGKTITGLRINRSWYDYMGLFGNIDGGTVKNVGVTNVDIYGKDYVGGIAGCVDNSSVVQNCYSTGSVSGSSCVGGVAGYVDRSSVVQNCYSTGSVSGSVSRTACVGGVAGFVDNSSVVQNCYSTGSVKGSGNNVGGIAGYITAGSKVQSCAALNSYISGPGNVGRVVGFSGGTLSGNIAFAGMDVLVGGNSKTPLYEGADKVDGQSMTVTEIKADETIGSLFTVAGGWNTQNGKLPGLLGNTVDMPAYLEDETPDSYFPGSGLEGDPFQIATAGQLAKLAELVNSDDPSTRNEYNNKYYKLTDNIDLSAYSNGEGWMPIGTGSKPFKGHFDGNNNIITGLRINRNEIYIGLFGFIEGNGATVKNLGLINVDITGSYYSGAVAGRLKNGSIQNCYCSGRISATEICGGLVGEVYEGTVQNCYSSAAISSSLQNSGHIGGVVGLLNGSSLENCYSSGSISGAYAGGVVGHATNLSKVQNCYSTGSVNGNKASGGVVGTLYTSTVQNCAALNPLVSGTSIDSIVGRVVGKNEGTLSGNIAFAGMDVKVNGSPKPVEDNAEGIDGQSKTAEDIKDTVKKLFDDDPWIINNGKLPILKGLEGQNDDFPSYISGFAGTGTSDDPYLIKTAADLAKLAEWVNAGTSPYADTGKYYKLENDIDLSDYGSTYNDGKSWVPIGTYNKPFNIACKKSSTSKQPCSL